METDMTEPQQRYPLYVFLIRVSAPTLRDASLAQWIDEIEEDYMSKFKSIGMSIAHCKLDDGAPWNFALVFPGTEESVNYLTDQITSRARGTEVLAMRGEDLDQFTARLRRTAR